MTFKNEKSSDIRIFSWWKTFSVAQNSASIQNFSVTSKRIWYVRIILEMLHSEWILEPWSTSRLFFIDKWFRFQSEFQIDTIFQLYVITFFFTLENRRKISFLSELRRWDQFKHKITPNDQKKWEIDYPVHLFQVADQSDQVDMNILDINLPCGWNEKSLN